MPKRKHTLKKFDYNTKQYIVNENGDQASRVVAFEHIYRKDREKYPLPFSKYVIHHIDRDTFNNSIKNLYICTSKEHNTIHTEEKRTGEKFETKKESLNSLNNQIRSLRFRIWNLFEIWCLQFEILQ